MTDRQFSTVEELTDHEIVKAIAAGSREALGTLYDRHGTAMMVTARRILRDETSAHDLVHDVFLEAWQQAGAYDPARASVRTWLMLRLRSRGLDRLRSIVRSRTDTVGVQGGVLEVATESDPTIGPDAVRVRKLLCNLPEGQRVLLSLTYFEGVSLSEAAEPFHEPIGTIKSRLSRALSRLREELEVGEDGDDAR